MRLLRKKRNQLKLRRQEGQKTKCKNEYKQDSKEVHVSKQYAKILVRKPENEPGNGKNGCR